MKMREYPVCESCDEPVAQLSDSITLTGGAICNERDMTKARAVEEGIYHRRCLRRRLGLDVESGEGYELRAGSTHRMPDPLMGQPAQPSLGASLTLGSYSTKRVA